MHYTRYRIVSYIDEIYYYIVGKYRIDPIFCHFYVLLFYFVPTVDSNVTVYFYFIMRLVLYMATKFKITIKYYGCWTLVTNPYVVLC